MFDFLTLFSYESPAVRTTTKGLKFTGEEYIAISVDVQTDESWLQQYDLRTGCYAIWCSKFWFFYRFAAV